MALEYERDKAFASLSGDGFSGVLGGYVPVQGEGMVDGHPWYFRARGASWSFSIAKNIEDDPVIVGWENGASGWRFFDEYGEWPEAGFMPYETAWEFITQSIDAFRRGEGYVEK